MRVSSSRTILTTCWVGERAESTSSPIAFSLTASISCLTTLKLTSASSSATRISRSAASMFAAVSLPSPRRFLKTRCSLSDKLSNMTALDYSRPQGGIYTRPVCQAVAFIYYRGTVAGLLLRESSAGSANEQRRTTDVGSDVGKGPPEDRLCNGLSRAQLTRWIGRWMKTSGAPATAYNL